MKTKEPKMKRLSVKGMKNMKYLGHFAQDKYMHKGHNLSGVYDFGSAVFGDSRQREKVLKDISQDPSTEGSAQPAANITEAASSGPTRKVRVVAPGYETSSAQDAQYIDVDRPLSADEQYLNREAALYNDRAFGSRRSDVREKNSGDFAREAKYFGAASASRSKIEDQNFVSNLYANRYRKNYGK
jgi:hypothetical protein